MQTKLLCCSHSAVYETDLSLLFYHFQLYWNVLGSGTVNESWPKTLDSVTYWPYKHCFSLIFTDMVAIPDFSAGAMENWGLITYRLTSLLYEPQKSPASSKQWVCYKFVISLKPFYHSLILSIAIWQIWLPYPISLLVLWKIGVLSHTEWHPYSLMRKNHLHVKSNGSVISICLFCLKFSGFLYSIFLYFFSIWSLGNF